MPPFSQDALQLTPAFDRQEEQFSNAFAIIRQAISDRAFPGASLAITYRGALIASQGFGRFTYRQNALEVNAETVFDLASVTKVVATTAIAMLLYQRAKFSLDQPVEKTLPEFITLVPKHQHLQRHFVTMRTLLAHSSGLPAYEKLFQIAKTRDDLVRAAITSPLVATPATRVEYSDVGFILLGEALSRIAGEPLDVFAQREIFTRLAMTRTCFNPPAEWKAEIPPTEDEGGSFGRVMQGEVNDENANVMGGVAGHAGVFASATDVARFAECMLRSGSPILQPGTVKLFTKRETTPPGTTWAVGWDMPSRPESSSGKFFSDRSIGHLGFTGTSLWIDPERQLSVTLLTNRTWPDRASRAIREVRPQVHDLIVEALEDHSAG